MRLVSTLALLLSSVALAQPFLPADQGRQLGLPPTSFALADDARALHVNPGALGALDGFELFGVGELRTAGRFRGGLMTGLDLGGLALGAGVETLGDAAATRRTMLGAALGTRHLGLGFTWNGWRSDTASTLDRAASWDLGLLLRPSDLFSIGAVIRNVDEPTRNGVTLPRTLGLGVGLRPFGPRFTLAADYRAAWHAIDDGVLGYTAAAEVWRGVKLNATYFHGFTATAPSGLQLGVGVDWERTGLELAGGAGPSQAAYVVAARMGSARRRPLQLAGNVALIDLPDRLREGGTALSELVGGIGDDPFIQVTRLLDAAARDPQLDGVLVKIDTLPDVGWAKANELRLALLRLRAAGKKVQAVLMNAGDPEYLVATGAEKVYAMQESFLAINGLAARATFLGGTLEKLGVHVDVARVGAFKNAPDAFTRTEMSPEQREAIQGYLGAQSAAYEEQVLAARRISREALAQALGYGLLAAEDAKRLGLIDDIVGPKELEDLVKKTFPQSDYVARYAPTGLRDDQWGPRRRIAVIPVLGGIEAGKSRRSPLGGEAVAGAETIVRAIERAKDDPRVAAIVLRVDSPGGGILPSDLIYRSLLGAREKKPVIASMGDLAASGGYYVSAPAHEILASPATITGSIGVFLIKPAFGGLMNKVGASAEAIVASGRPNILDTTMPWTPEEQQLAQTWVERSYQHFIGLVAENRKLTKEQVDAIGRGRVWSGHDARQRGLVDGFGGLHDAIASARKRAKISEGEELDIVVYGDPRGLLAGLGGEEGVLAGVELPVDAPLPPALKKLAAELAPTAGLLESTGVQARMEYGLRVE